MNHSLLLFFSLVGTSRLVKIYNMFCISPIRKNKLKSADSNIHLQKKLKYPITWLRQEIFCIVSLCGVHKNILHAEAILWEPGILIEVGICIHLVSI